VTPHGQAMIWSARAMCDSTWPGMAKHGRTEGVLFTRKASLRAELTPALSPVTAVWLVEGAVMCMILYANSFD